MPSGITKRNGRILTAPRRGTPFPFPVAIAEGGISDAPSGSILGADGTTLTVTNGIFQTAPVIAVPAANLVLKSGFPSAPSYQSLVLNDLPRTLYSATDSTTVANTVTETSIVGTGAGTLTLPANYFKTGRGVRLRAHGYWSTTGTPTFRIRGKLAGSADLDTGAVNSPTNAASHGWSLEMIFVCRTTGVGGTVMEYGIFMFHDPVNFNAVVFPMANSVAASDDTTGTLAVDLSLQWGTAAAGNTLTRTILTLEPIA